jgi:hypothetical protein
MSRDERLDVRVVVERMARYGVPREILDKLALYLREANDRELFKFNPRYLAARLGIDAHTALGVLAYAVQEGLFDLNWDVHCPHCGGRARTFFTLRDGRGEEFCPNCQVNFDPHLDHEVHVTFTVSETVRTLATQEPLPDELYPPTFGLELLNGFCSPTCSARRRCTPARATPKPTAGSATTLMCCSRRPTATTESRSRRLATQ